jgi:plasmid replication initiation protein
VDAAMGNKNGLVVKSNRLVEASYRLDLIEQRIILASIVMARESQMGLGDGFVTLEAKWFAQMFGMEEGSVYGQLKAAVDKLFNRFIVVRDIYPESGKERFSKVRWISRASYIDGAGKIQIRFAQDMVPYITRLEAEFTRYKLEKVARMSSAYAIRLYELLMQWGSIGQREIELEWLKKALMVDKDYPRLFDFKKWVIDVALSQINEYSDLNASYSQRKTGRNVTHLIFTFSPKEEPKPKKARTRKAKTRKPAQPPAGSREYIEKHALPGESWEQAARRLQPRG